MNRICRTLALLTLLMLPRAAAAQSAGALFGAGGGVTSVPRAGSNGCGGHPARMTGFSGEARAGLRLTRVEIFARATHVLNGTRSSADCFVPQSGLHTRYRYHELESSATLLDASLWYSLLGNGRVLAGLEAGAIASHSVYGGATLAVTALRRRARLEVGARLHSVEYERIELEYANSQVIRELSRVSERETLPGYGVRAVFILP